ncbi:hypothetical protein B484DRAFT_444965 [Ochromonadaceae sp. CCMP2298]|nr:hypothetical protein B484DRAFT_444965 [Ochromonadaceae sp. CCMP2298]|mmetsp:Transcript_33558/g.73957  ORF Transcript_33558/g.73957 Transcript_33558/m.73957 type:complete len:289 (-) Transcript_33558:165-1031(-)
MLPTVNVAYEIFDVGIVKKKSSRRLSVVQNRPSVPRASVPTAKPEMASKSHQSPAFASFPAPPAGNSSGRSPSRSPSRSPEEKRPLQSAFNASPTPLHLLPKRPPSGPSARRGPHPRPPEEKHPWNMNVTCPDRDDLILQQDLKVSRARMPGDATTPRLLDSSSRKERKENSFCEHRDRPFHHSFSAVANDPLPFHPDLHELGNLGIHHRRWTPGEFPEKDTHHWDKPRGASHPMGRSQFQQEYRIEPSIVPVSRVDAKHSMASVVSSYSVARKLQRGLRPKGEVQGN